MLLGSLCCPRASHKSLSVRVQNLELRIEGVFVVTSTAFALNLVWSQYVPGERPGMES